MSGPFSVDASRFRVRIGLERNVLDRGQGVAEGSRARLRGTVVQPGRAGSVYGRQPGAPPQGQLQRGDVGEADDQLRIRPYGVQVEPVDDPLGAVPAPGTDDGAYGRVTQGAVERGQARLVGPGEVAVPGVHVRARLDPQTPGRQQLDAPGHPLGAGRSGRRHQHHGVAGLERGRTYRHGGQRNRIPG